MANAKPETITIDDVKYVRADSRPNTEGEIKIVVLDRGFVYVGAVKIADGFIVITGARNIRVYGTSKGLGELISGPTKDTKLDYAGTVRAPLHALIHTIDVEQAKWTA